MRNVLLIVVDTLRPDRLGCYGHDRPASPHLDALAAQGVRLTDLWSASNFTAPAFTSLFTGLYPHQHGVFDFTARTSHATVKRVLQANQARLGAVVSFRFFRNLLGEVWDDITAVTDTSSFDYSKDLPRAVTAESLDWLRRHGCDGPFSLFVHYDGPHMPYRLPDEYAHRFDTVDPADVDPDFLAQLFPQEQRKLNDSNTDSMFRLLNEVAWGRRKLTDATRRWMLDKYDASILYNDAAIGELLAGLEDLGLADDTIVAVLSDHGEEFHEHGNLGHAGVHLYEEVIRTVGIVRDPSRAGAGGVVSTPLSQTEVWPTLLQLAGARELPEAWQRRGFAERVAQAAAGSGETGAIEEASPVFCQGLFKAAARLGNRKLILARPGGSLSRLRQLRFRLKMALQRELGDELYDLASDPGESRNRARERALAGPLRAALDRHLAESAEDVEAAIHASDEQRARIEKEMRDLGYM